MVALALLGTVLLFVFNTFSYQHSTYTVVDQVSEAQQNARAIARLIERDIRNAGYLVPPAAAACGVDSNNTPDQLFLSDTDAILPADQLDVFFAGKELGGQTSNKPASAGALTVNVDSVVIDGVASYDTNADGTDDSDFRVGAGAILVDRGNPGRGVACGIVSSVPTSTSVEVTFSNILGTSGASGEDLVLVPANVYRIVDPGAPDPPRLERNGVLLAKDVEDLQASWVFDDDRDDVIDAGERRAVTGTNYVNSTVDGSLLREIRMNLVMRTRANDPRNPDNFSIGQPLENRTVVSAPAQDGRHRRVHTASVRLRNLTL